MAKKTRKRTAAKVTKKSKALTKKKSAISKKRRKVAAQKKSKPIAKKKLIAKKKPAEKKISTQPPESFPHKVADAFTAIVDILTDAEQLHHKLDPGVSNEPE